MSGITQDELMQMAREAGVPEEIVGSFRMRSIERFTNAILERAAMGFEDDDEWQESRYTGRAVSRKIRALKINTGD